MERLEEQFNRIPQKKTYRRVDDNHPLNLYIGKNEWSQWTLLLLTPFKPKQIVSSKFIKAVIGQRNDNQWTVSLSLLNDDYKDLFLLFCGDLIESSRLISSKEKGAKFIVARYEEWKEMLANPIPAILTPEKIKGLLGEMYILDNELMDRYGADKAALSWTGPKAAHQDFMIDDTWYEVKTVSSGKDEVKISSIEQLDSKNAGELIVVFADKTSITNNNAINLNIIYHKLLCRLTNDDVKSEFSNMLLRYGFYPRPEYESVDYTFEIKGTQHYIVSESFPCFRRKNIPADITRAEYYLSLATINNFKK